MPRANLSGTIFHARSPIALTLVVCTYTQIREPECIRMRERAAWVTSHACTTGRTAPLEYLSVCSRRVAAAAAAADDDRESPDRKKSVTCLENWSLVRRCDSISLLNATGKSAHRVPLALVGPSVWSIGDTLDDHTTSFTTTVSCRAYSQLLRGHWYSRSMMLTVENRLTISRRETKRRTIYMCYTLTDTYCFRSTKLRLSTKSVPLLPWLVKRMYLHLMFLQSTDISFIYLLFPIARRTVVKWWKEKCLSRGGFLGNAGFTGDTVTGA